MSDFHDKALGYVDTPKEECEHCLHDEMVAFFTYPAQNDAICCFCREKIRVVDHIESAEGHGPYHPMK